MEKKTLKSRVLYILEKYPFTRNDDLVLTLYLWREFYPSKIQRDENNKAYIFVEDIKLLPREDHIKRVRANIQNKENKFLPTDINVVKARKLNEEIWREKMRFNDEYRRL